MIMKDAGANKGAVYQIWKQQFQNDDGGYTDYYFEYLYDQAITYVKLQGDEVCATLQRRKHTIVFYEVEISTSMILGIATLPSFQKQGHMHALLNEVLKKAQQEEWLTLIQAYNPDLYKPFGFEVYYYQKDVIWVPTKKEGTGALMGMDEQACLALYQKEMDQKNGFIQRDLLYYQLLDKELKAQGFAFYTYCEACKVQAYACLEKDDGYLVSECIGSEEAKEQLKNKLSKKFGQIKIRMMSDDIHDIPYTMVKFHDWSAFQKQFQITYETPALFFQNIRSSLYMHENA